MNTSHLFQRLSQLLILIFLGSIVTLTGCSHYPNQPFKLMDEKHAVKPTTIAIIAGTNSDGPRQLALNISDKLRAQSNFKVLTQDEIEKRLPNYPVEIELKDLETLNKEENEPTSVWYLSSEKAKLDAIQKKLKVDYLYVVWIPWMRSVTYQGKTTYNIWPSANMIEYPGSRIVASTKIHRNISDSILALFRPEDYYVLKLIDESAEDIVDEIVNVTHSAKQK